MPMLDSPVSVPTRRARISLPSIWAHLFWAIAVMGIMTIGIWVYVETFGDPKSSIPIGTIQVDAQPLPPESDTLAGSSANLPDLLEGDVPQNVNPTTILQTPPTIDALGNPLPGTTNQPPENPAFDENSGSQTIMINGQMISGGALPPAPISGLTRTATFGPIPSPDGRGLTPLSAYKKPFSKPVGQSPVSVIIGGLGINRAVTQQAIATLPPEVTLSFAAHAPGLQNWINQARQAGHEVLLELPMESSDFDPSEPGADRALMSDNPQGRNIRNLEWMMSRAQGYFGVTNFNGDKFLGRTDALAPIIESLAKSGLSFIFDGSSSVPSLGVVTSSAALPYAQAYTLLDLNPDSANIEMELARLQAKASSGNGAIGFGFAYPQTIASVSSWSQRLSDQNLVLAPASSTLP